MIKKILLNIINRKSAAELIDNAKKGSLKKTLSAFDLFIIGIGAIVGTGILTIVGTAIQGGPESSGAGPAIVISMIIAAIACVFCALCYAEVASIIPVSGSVYTYAYASLGEFAAWIVGWALMLNYVIGNIAVSSSWCGYLTQLLKGFSKYLPDFVINFPLWLRNDVRSIMHMCDKYSINPHDVMPYLFDKIPIAINLPVIALTLVVTLILVKGIRESTRFATVMVCLNLFMIISFVVVGAPHIDTTNWTPFAPNGLQGIMMGAFIIFFAYIGIDAVTATAEEAKNPQRDIPMAIFTTLIFCTVLYVLVALVLTGICPMGTINIQAPIASALSAINKDYLACFISIASVCALASVFLICQLASTRILYAMSRDKFLPRMLRAIHKKHRTPHVLTWSVGIVTIICSLFMDLNISAQLCNYGTFTSFIAICIAVLVLRKTEPNLKRSFKIPLMPLFPVLGIVSSLALMIFSLKELSASKLMFLLWILIGIAIYFGFSYKNLRK